MSSNGPLIDLIAKGAQDEKLISKDLTNSFFQDKVISHTNFSRGSISVDYKGSGNWGSSIKFLIPKDGDLISSMYLNLKLPTISNQMITNNSINKDEYKVRWSDFLGNGIIEKIILRIGGQIIVEQSGTFMEIHTDFYDEDWSKRIMSGHTETLNTPSSEILGEELFIPLKFWFSDNLSKALPVIALQYHDIELEVKLRNFHQCYMVLKEITDLYDVHKKTYVHTDEKLSLVSLDKISLEVMYVYVDINERKKLAQMEHQFLITQVQERSLPVTHNGSIDLNFNHPVKEIFFLLQPNENIKEAELFNFTNKLTYLPAIYQDISSVDITEYKNLPKYHLLDEARILFNGIERVPWKNYKYFFYLQNYEHYRIYPENYVYVYSFALDPTNKQPTGSCNFSRIDNAQLQFKLYQVPIRQVNSSDGLLNINGSINVNNPGILRIFAINFNYLIIKNGMAGLEFNN
jgi:hypothetical protein